jgi:hypothetical protein
MGMRTKESTKATHKECNDSLFFQEMSRLSLCARYVPVSVNRNSRDASQDEVCKTVNCKKTGEEIKLLAPEFGI